MSSKVKKVWKNDDGYLRAERMTRLILLSVGLWPRQKDYPRFLRNFLVAICVVLNLFTMIPLGIFICSDAPNISVSKKNHLEHVIIAIALCMVQLQLSAPLLFNTLCISKYASLMWKGPKIESCLRRMAADWRNIKDPLEKSIMLDYSKRARSMTKFCMALAFSAGLFYSTVGPLCRAPIVVDNVTLHQLAYPGNFIFFNPRTRPAYDYVFALQSLGSVVKFFGVCSVFIWFVMHISSRIDVLSSTIERAVDQLDNLMLKRIVDDQLNLYRLAKELGHIFNELCLVEFVGNTVLICLVGYYLIIALLQRNYTRAYPIAISLSSMTYNLYILCYYGQILMDKFDELGRSIYMTDWHKLSGSNARSVVLLLVRANRPFALTAGKLIVLSMASFAKVIKTSATYFNVLWNITSHSMNAQ